MSKNLFLLDRQDTVQKDSTETDASIAHNESIAENFLKLIGDGEKIEEKTTEENTTKEIPFQYNNTIDFLRQAFVDSDEEQAENSNEYNAHNEYNEHIVAKNMQFKDNVEEQQFIPQNEMDDISIENNIDLLPTETTTQYAHTLYEDEAKEIIENKKTVLRSKKASILIAVGIAIMAIILALICINVGVINNLQNNLDSTIERYNLINKDLKEKQKELLHQLNPETIIQNAKDKLNMIER